jgi:SAM-dependent methyltransferase
VRLDAQRKFFERLGSTDKQLRVFDGLHHDILHEVQRSEVLNEIRQFVLTKFEEPPAKKTLLNADCEGYTKDEFDRLNQPRPWWCAKRWWYGAQVGVMKTIGRLSDGVRLGWRTGFDSGQSLDYVYENRPRGRLGLGWLIDRIYLNAVGWRGVRARRQHLQALLKRAIDQLRAQGESVRITDVAAGGGRYVLQTLADLPPKTVDSVLLRDHNPANLEACRELAAKLDLASKAHIQFEQADAFDEASLATIDPKPSIVIVSGLYELFPDNTRILASLRGIARAIQPGGLLIYTGQPWHPQIEMIARTLTNREGKPWIMRRRTQRELDELVRSAGFEKLDMEIDRAGIFTVSLARIGASR